MSTLDKFHSNTIIRNKNYETDLKYDLELNRMLLKIIGVWPTDLKHLTIFDRIIAVLTKFLTIFMLLFYMIPIGCHVLLVEKSWSVRIQLLVTVMYCFEALVKYGIAIALNDKLKCCIDIIDSDWREVDWTVYRSIMLENSRSCRIFTKLLITITYSSLIMYHFIVPFVFVKLQRLGPNGTNLTPILYDTEFLIVDSRVSPMCEIVYIGQTLGAATACCIHCGICTIIVKFAMHACTRYQMVIVLMQYIDNVKNDCNDLKCQVAKQRIFEDIIRRHLNATEFVPRIEKALNGMCFVCLMANMVNMCFIAYTMIMEWERNESGTTTSFAFGAMSFVSNIFVLCYCGEQLGEQCRRVSTAGYMTNWWNMQFDESRSLILIIAVAQLPIQFTAGKLFTLSMKTFSTVMKISITYLNVLRTMIQFHE